MSKQLPEWLDECVDPDGTRIVEGSTECGWVSWTSESPRTIVLDGDFTLEQLKELVAMMEAAPPP
jgi:hypothetical protein